MMTGEKDASAYPGSASKAPLRYSRVHASRVPTPQACGCGQPVAFDAERHEFFCIGCGRAKECLCRRSWLSSNVRPVNVV